MIVTERLTLRLPRPLDLADIHEIFGDPAVMTYWSCAAHQTMAETAAWLQPLFDMPEASPFDYFIEFEGRIIGKMGSWQLPNLGYALNRAYWGKGIAEEALKGLIAHLKISRPCDFLFADVDPRNTASAQLLLKCGFCHVGFAARTLHTHIGWCDSDYYKLDL